MIALAIDASNYLGTVAVIRDQTVLASGEAQMRSRDTESLMPAVVAVLQKAGVLLGDLDRIVCGEGPGSFTSLRIAASIAKGLSLGSTRPLYAVPSLALIVARDEVPPGRYVATLDALRDEWYAGVYEKSSSHSVREERSAILVSKAELPSVAASVGAKVIGIADGGLLPHASGVGRLLDRLTHDGPVDLDAWEPRYGRLAEAQVKWEAAHGRPIGTP